MGVAILCRSRSESEGIGAGVGGERGRASVAPRVALGGRAKEIKGLGVDVRDGLGIGGGVEAAPEPGACLVGRWNGRSVESGA